MADLKISALPAARALADDDLVPLVQSGETRRASWSSLRAAVGGTGAAGAQGLKGDTGATGPQGPKGDTGAAGPQGPAGPAGSGTGTGTGATGPQGPKGDAGAIGATGPQGPKGDKGDKGDRGDAGPTGPAGPAGSGGGGGASALVGHYPVDARGAIGDGASHPLSQRFSTLAQAQAVYPHALALTDEIDWAAIQGAINAARTAGGGVVQLAARRYVLNRTLLIPEARPFPDNDLGAQVDLVGAGQYATVLHWQTDLGSGKYAIACGDPAATRANGLGRYRGDGMYEGVFADFTVRGPNAPGALGAVFTQMSGIMWGARRRLYRVRACRFWAGIDIVGDHCSFWDCIFNDCYYGAYWNERSAILYGDLAFYKCYFNGARKAAIGVHPGATLAARFFHGYIGGAPYAIFGETGSSASPLMEGTLFDSIMFEYVGNGHVHDDRYVAGEGLTTVHANRGVERCTWNTCFFSWSDGNKLADRPRQAAIVAGRIANTSILRTQTDGLLGPGTRAMFITRQLDGLHIEGGVRLMGELCVGANVPVLRETDLFGVASLTWEEGGKRGCALTVAGGCAARDVIEADGYGGARGNSGNNRPVVGVALCATASYGEPFVPALVVTEGMQVDVNFPAATENTWTKKGPNGTAVVATGPTDGTVVGWAGFKGGADVGRLRLR